MNAVMPLTLRIQRIWPKRNDGLWLLTERTDTNHCSQVWHFYIQDDSTLVMQFLVFRAEEKTLQQGKDNMQAPVIRMNNLLTRGGCERYLKKTRTGYVGRSAGKDCLADKTGTDYFTCDMEFTRNTLIWQETRFNKDNEKKGSETFHFVKQANSLK
ncbi:MAG: CpcT/CpeT family chromophore lyase [Bacteroidota bacterium]